jgi:hypothetical protein
MEIMMGNQILCPKCGNPAVVSRKEALDLNTGKPIKSSFMGFFALFVGLAFTLAGIWYTLLMVTNPQSTSTAMKINPGVCMPVVFFFGLAGTFLSYGWQAVSTRMRGNYAVSLDLACPACKNKWSQLQAGEKIYPGIEQDWCLRRIQTTTGKVRTDAILDLGEVGDEKALDTLFKILSDRSAAKLYDRVAAAEALGDLGYSSAVEPLVSVLDDHPLVVNKAVTALGEIGDARAIQPLSQILIPGGEIPPAGTGPSAKDYISKGKDGVKAEQELRWLAATSLSKIKNPAAIEVLRKAQEDADQAVRQVAQDAVSEYMKAEGELLVPAIG